MDINCELEAGRAYLFNHEENGFKIFGQYMLYTAEFDVEVGSLVSEPYSLELTRNGVIIVKIVDGPSGALDIPKNIADIQRVIADDILSSYSQMSSFDTNNISNDKDVLGFLLNAVWEIS